MFWITFYCALIWFSVRWWRRFISALFDLFSHRPEYRLFLLFVEIETPKKGNFDFFPMKLEQADFLFLRSTVQPQEHVESSSINQGLGILFEDTFFTACDSVTIHLLITTQHWKAYPAQHERSERGGKCSKVVKFHLTKSVEVVFHITRVARRSALYRSMLQT